MASGTQRGPITVPQERDGPRQGLVGVRRVHVLVHVGQPRHAGHVLQPGGVRLRPRREPDPVDRPGRDRGDVPGGRLCRPHRGDAAGGRRLHLAEPRSSTGSRASLTGAVVGGDRRASSSPSALGLDDTVAHRRGRRRRRRRRDRSAGSTAASGSSWPPPAGGSSSRCGRRSTARSSTSSSSSRWRRWSSPPTACRSSPRRTASCSCRS